MWEVLVDYNNKYHTTGSTFTLTSTETKLKAYWDSFYMPIDAANGYQAAATLILPQGEWYVCFIAMDVNDKAYITDVGISVTENVTYKNVANPENVDSRLRTIHCDVDGNVGIRPQIHDFPTYSGTDCFGPYV